MLYLFNVGCSSTWGGETGSPPLMSIGFFFLNRGFFGGRGIARPLPHILGVYINIVAVFFGGGRIGTSPSSQCRGVLRRSRDGPSLLTNPASTSEGEGQALFLTMSVRSATTCWLCRSAIVRCGAVCEDVRGRSRTRSTTVGTLR